MTRIALLLVMLGSTGALAQSDELGEATGLTTTPDTPPLAVSPLAPSERSNDAVRWRAHGIMDWHTQSQPLRKNHVTSGPNFELGGALDLWSGRPASLFVEGRELYDHTQQKTSGVLDQGGIRLSPSETTLLVAGKERSRRSPALIVSPSDFLHSDQALPGLREDRGGIWVGRAAWQTSDQSLELLTLPVNETNADGLPSPDSSYWGNATRYFGHYKGVDFGLDAGRIGGHDKIGAFLQTVAWNTWKIYGETGQDLEWNAASHLLGIGYEGSSVFALRAEWYGRDKDWVPSSFLFTDQSYAIGSLTISELFDVFNISSTYVRSLESEKHLLLQRLEWLATSRQVLGLTMLRLMPDQPFSWQLIADWKVSL